MHPNLSFGLNAAVQAGEENPVIDIKSQKKGTMFDVMTGHTKYTVVVVDPEKQEIAMVTDNPNIQGADIWYLMGAGWGGSMIKIGCIVVGGQMRARRLSGGLIETSGVKSLTLRDEPKKAKRIMREAESRRPQFMSKEETRQYETKFTEKVDELIAKEFPSDKQEWVREMVSRFGNMPAKGTVLGVLSQAQKYGKLEKARKILERDWEKDWQFQPPSVTGDPELMPLNAHRWDRLYAELGIPLPNKG